jgi:hypothetical protein
MSELKLLWTITKALWNLWKAAVLAPRPMRLQMAVYLGAMAKQLEEDALDQLEIMRIQRDAVRND